MCYLLNILATEQLNCTYMVSLNRHTYTYTCLWLLILIDYTLHLSDCQKSVYNSRKMNSGNYGATEGQNNSQSFEKKGEFKIVSFVFHCLFMIMSRFYQRIFDTKQYLMTERGLVYIKKNTCLMTGHAQSIVFILAARKRAF